MKQTHLVKYNTVVKIVFAYVAGMYLCFSGPCFAQTNAAAAKQPNIIFLLTDDQRWDALGIMGNPVLKTPNIDALARQGVLFTSAFVTTAICAVSRASFLSGQYAARHGIIDFKGAFSPQALAQTYPMLLKQAGYRVGFIGKYGIGVKGSEPVNDFDYFFGSSEQPHYENIDENGSFIHYTDLVQKHINHFLDVQENKPFCLSVSFKAPHVQDEDPRQMIYANRYKNLYSDAVIPIPETADPKYWEAFPSFFKANNEGRKRWKLLFSTPEKYQESVKGYYRLIAGIDDAVAHLRQKLKIIGVNDNTIIIYAGDNGFYLGEHGLSHKWYGHEESIRVPLIIYDPRLPAAQQGQQLHQLVLNIDVAPTILSYANLAIPGQMQGCNLRPLYSKKGKAPRWRNEFYYEHMVPIPTIPKSQGFRNKRYKYLVYPESSPVYEEVYDLQNDPHEKYNLALTKTNAAIVQKLRNEFNQLKMQAK